MKINIGGIKYDPNDWVVVKARKAQQVYKNPKNNKAPKKVVNELQPDEEIMRISHARKLGIM